MIARCDINLFSSVGTTELLFVPVRNLIRKQLNSADFIDILDALETQRTLVSLQAKETYMARCAELDKLRADQTASAKEINKV